MNEYPTEQELKTIEEWGLLKSGLSGLLEFIKNIWYWPDWGFTLTKKKVLRHGRKRKILKLELHTGGWSGNEEIIAALEKNLMFWPLLWVKSERGGHYYFEIPENLEDR